MQAQLRILFQPSTFLSYALPLSTLPFQNQGAEGGGQKWVGSDGCPSDPLSKATASVGFMNGPGLGSCYMDHKRPVNQDLLRPPLKL